MARKSRKSGAIASSAPVEKQIVYSAALYARLSVENERKIASDSIGTQIQLLKDFASEQTDMEVFDIYCDDDITGTDFGRPDFARMMNDIRDKKVNCVIVKDLSRLGRNFIESGEYIEMVFPFFGVRFIAVTNQFDSKYQQADIAVQLQNMANEMYAKDISRKICSTMRSMNAKGVPSPGRILYDRGVATTDHFKNSKWYMQTVRRILQNQIYLGWMVSGKFRSDYYATGKKGCSPLPKEEWTVTKGTHEPIVTEDLFERAQAYLNR